MRQVLAFVLTIIAVKVFFPALTDSVLQVLDTMLAVIQNGLDLILNGLGPLR